MITLLTVLFVIITLLLIFMVVITPSSEGGIAAAFGGMGSDTFFGTKAHRHINKFTLFLAVSFLVLAFSINILRANETSDEDADKDDSPNTEETE